MEAAFPNNAQTNPDWLLGDGPTLFRGLAGEYVFNLPFDIEIGPFDADGFAVTRAVNWGGEDITEETAKEAMRLAQYKLPVKTKFISVDKNLEAPPQAKTKNNKQSQEEVKQ